MREIDNGGYAFPHETAGGYALPGAGMTLRDWFAGQAMAALESPTDYVGRDQTDQSYRRHAKKAYQIADAMIAARKGGVA